MMTLRSRELTAAKGVSMSLRVTHLVLLFTGMACFAGCKPNSGNRADSGPHDGGGPENTAGVCRDGVDNDGDGAIDCEDSECRENGFCEVEPDAGDDADAEECAWVSVGAETTSEEVDIIWIIDSSGSMRGEAEIVQENMNAFAADINASGVDFRVVLISDPAYVDMPAPLGEDTSRYFFVAQPVRSDQVLAELLDQLPVYRGFLRSGAITHVVGVTDDESEMEAADFRGSMEAELGHTFTFHAIASETAFHDCDPLGTNCDPGCEGPNGAAADIGATYYELAELTEGEQFSICTASWSALFETLRDVVVVSATIPCAYQLPDPPPGMSFDPDLVNVVYTDDEEGEHVFARAMSAERCDDELAWYYDSNDSPTRIQLCEAACALVGEAVTGQVDIALGCAPDEVIY